MQAILSVLSDFFTQVIMLSENKDKFVCSFPNCMLFFLLFVCFLIALARTSILMLKRSCERGHPYLKPDLSGKASGFSSNVMFPVGFYCKLFIKVRKFLFIPSFLSIFLFFIMSGEVGFCHMIFLCIYWSCNLIFLSCWYDGLH